LTVFLPVCPFWHLRHRHGALYSSRPLRANNEFPREDTVAAPTPDTRPTSGGTTPNTASRRYKPLATSVVSAVPPQVRQTTDRRGCVGVTSHPQQLVHGCRQSPRTYQTTKREETKTPYEAPSSPSRLGHSRQPPRTPLATVREKTKAPYEAPSSPLQLAHSRPLAGEEQVVQSCTMPSHSRTAVRRKVDGGSTSKSEVAKSTHTRVPPARGCN